MKKLILIKYGELTTKKGNRSYFINTLKENIISALSKFESEIKYDYYRMFINIKEEYITEAVNILSNIYGIHEIVVSYQIDDKDLDSIKKYCLEIIKKEECNTFKIETKRSDKTFETKSMDVNKYIGGYILKNTDLKVDVHNPEILLTVEIRKEAVYIYGKGLPGKGGYPVGTLGSALLMLSGGIDSPVAGYLTIKRGVKLNYIYFESRPHTSIEARNKVIELAKKLEKYNNKGKIYIVNFTKIQETIYKNLNETYLITFMRRNMYKIAEKLAKRIGALAIVNGEAVGQVASQTLSSMVAVNEVTNYPILRPLCSFDKNEIIKIAKEIDTYDISILPYEDCCTVFVPKHPIINPSLKVVHEEEKKIDFESLINECIKNIEVIDLSKEQINEYL